MLPPLLVASLVGYFAFAGLIYLPVFFAVTIPQENMQRYFANLQMEGMAYRLMDEASPEGVPTTDADKVDAWLESRRRRARR